MNRRLRDKIRPDWPLLAAIVALVLILVLAASWAVSEPPMPPAVVDHEALQQMPLLGPLDPEMIRQMPTLYEKCIRNGGQWVISQVMSGCVMPVPLKGVR
jgi:hypothetical protein